MIFRRRYQQRFLAVVVIAWFGASAIFSIMQRMDTNNTTNTQKDKAHNKDIVIKTYSVEDINQHKHTQPILETQTTIIINQHKPQSEQNNRDSALDQDNLKDPKSDSNQKPISNEAKRDKKANQEEEEGAPPLMPLPDQNDNAKTTTTTEPKFQEHKSNDKQIESDVDRELKSEQPFPMTEATTTSKKEHNQNGVIQGAPPDSKNVPEPQPDENNQIGPDVQPKQEPNERKSEEDNDINIEPPMPKFYIDPHNPIYHRGNKSQPGELGEGVSINKTALSAEQLEIYEKGFKDNSFNNYASDMISVYRSLPEHRVKKECKEATYSEHLAQVVVVVIFHNEAWSVLLRTMHSILERTPEHLLHEVILVDDASDKEHLHQQLDDYVAMFPKVKLERMGTRQGLIRARLRGAEVSTAPVLVYLDSHCECMDRWVEPLLDRIHEDPGNVVCPTIDIISDDDLQYNYMHSLAVGGFDWSLIFNWHTLPKRLQDLRKTPIDPMPSPTMAGGLFAIDRKFFEKLGLYDSGFDIWGGENLELSFKAWMCGGRLEIIPCSHVGHIFRKKSPYKWRTNVDVLKKNTVRLAEVWVDEYKQYYYERINNNLGDYGNVSDRIALRKSLHCHSFKWYLENVFPELFIPGDAVAKGEVRNQGRHGQMCLDSKSNGAALGKPMGLFPCHKQGGNQFFMLSKDGEIRRDEACLDASAKGILVFGCHGQKGNQQWWYDDNKMLIYQKGNPNKCLEMNKTMKQVYLNSKCDENNKYQQWKFGEYNIEKAKQYGIEPS